MSCVFVKLLYLCNRKRGMSAHRGGQWFCRPCFAEELGVL